MGEEKLENPRASEKTLRDDFAGKVMQGMLASKSLLMLGEKLISEPKEFAKASYDFADAMLKQRQKE